MLRTIAIDAAGQSADIAAHDIEFERIERAGGRNCAPAFRCLGPATGAAEFIFVHLPKVLVPAYNCGSEISPVVATGARVLMYRVDKNAEVVVDDILRRLSHRTKVICVTHYFGRPSALQDLASICRERGVKLLEDCALSAFTAGIGQTGDAAIFSLRKFLPASDGGVLAIRPPGIGGEFDLGVEAPPHLAVRGTLSLLKRWMQRWSRISVRSGSSGGHGIETTDDADETALPDVPSSYYFAPGAPVVGASRLARGLLNRIDKFEIVDRRRRNFHLLRRLMKDASRFVPLWPEDELEPGVCPLGLPILVEDKTHWCRSLNRAGVSVSPWWSGFHRGLHWDQFAEARKLKQQLILLPVHQGLTAGDMEYIASVARRID